MTPKQIAYASHRASGLGQAQAAKAAGYAPGSAKVIASRMERLPAIKAAIAEARKAKLPDAAEAGPVEFEDAQSYLAAVVRGVETPDPVRVGAARALLPFERARQRAPLKGPTPRQLDRRDAQAGEQELLNQWAEKAAQVRARLKLGQK